MCAVCACAGLRACTSSCGTRNCPRCARPCARGELVFVVGSCSRCVRARVVLVIVMWSRCVRACARARGRGVVVFWSCARGCHVLALCSYLSCARVVCARARGVFALCSCLFRARVVFVFVVRSRCARVCCVLALCLCLLFSHVALVSWCARVELVLVVCSR